MHFWAIKTADFELSEQKCQTQYIFVCYDMMRFYCMYFTALNDDYVSVLCIESITMKNTEFSLYGIKTVLFLVSVFERDGIKESIRTNGSDQIVNLSSSVPFKRQKLRPRPRRTD